MVGQRVGHRGRLHLEEQLADQRGVGELRGRPPAGQRAEPLGVLVHEDLARLQARLIRDEDFRVGQQRGR